MQNVIKKGHKLLISLIITIGVILILVGLFLGYFGNYYSATEDAENALTGSESVTVTKIDGGYFFDGPSNDTAFVFYPGAKVEATSYAYLMLKISELGIDCFLADMPFNFALFNMNAADEFINQYDYNYWIVGGHSLGGVAASNYATTHTDKVSGVVLLASYSTKEIDCSFKVCSIYGKEDGCLNLEEYENNRKNLPENTMECIIEGGNHAGFGYYGDQKGDGKATVSKEGQQGITAKMIVEYFLGITFD